MESFCCLGSFVRDPLIGRKSFCSLSHSSVFLYQSSLSHSLSGNFSKMHLRKVSSSRLEASFRKAKRSQCFTGAETHTLHNATRSDDMNFRNAAKADRKMSYSAFVDSLSHCLPFQLLGPRRAIGQIMRTAPSIDFAAGAPVQQSRFAERHRSARRRAMFMGIAR
jgi:hypothetical protein